MTGGNQIITVELLFDRHAIDTLWQEAIAISVQPCVVTGLHLILVCSSTGFYPFGLFHVVMGAIFDTQPLNTLKIEHRNSRTRLSVFRYPRPQSVMETRKSTGDLAVHPPRHVTFNLRMTQKTSVPPSTP